MITLPTSVVKLGNKAGRWFVKHGPAIANIAGAGMAIGGAVMACNATMKVDAVLEAHKAQIDRIRASQELMESGDATAGELTMHDIKQAKFETYLHTGVELVKLYGPAVTVGMSGIGLMQAAYIVTDRRRASAVAALTAIDQAYNDLLARSQQLLPEGSADLTTGMHKEERMVSFGEEDEPEMRQVLVLDPVDEKSFTFIIDEDNQDWDKLNFTSMYRQYTAPLDYLNFGLEGSTRSHVWVNNILRLWNENEVSYGDAYGWNGLAGDTIAYDVTPYKVAHDAETGEKVYIEISEEEFNDFEHQDILTGYALGITLKASCEGYDDLIPPRLIFDEVYGK